MPSQRKKSSKTRPVAEIKKQHNQPSKRVMTSQKKEAGSTKEKREEK